MSGRLADRRAIVTGAASGIGEAIARRFAEEGAAVLRVDRQTCPPGPRPPLELDITDPDAPAQLIEAVEERLGSLDILVNNAGICITGGIEDQRLEDFERTLGVNVLAPFRLTQALLPLLKASPAGRIINLGSVMSEMGAPGLLAYGTSKHAVAGLTKAMAADLGKYGITANYLQPGTIRTPMAEEYIENPEFLKYWQARTPLGRVGEPEEVADVAVFLASDLARYVTGTGVRVCGGATVRL